MTPLQSALLTIVLVIFAWPVIRIGLALVAFAFTFAIGLATLPFRWAIAWIGKRGKKHRQRRGLKP